MRAVYDTHLILLSAIHLVLSMYIMTAVKTQSFTFCHFDENYMSVMYVRNEFWRYRPTKSGFKKNDCI